MNAAVFIGSTLRIADAQAVLEATYLPPVKQGDVRRLVAKGVAAIGIIDGFFHSVRSVWHKEILWAMSEGVHVYGSASMGALRAAELHAFGMVGVGRIFQMYRDGVLEDDDEVAVIHAPAEQEYVALSAAMVNIRVTLSSAANAQVISVETARLLESEAKSLYFPHRSYSKLLDSEKLSASERKNLRDWLPKGEVDQKRSDAQEMLLVMKDGSGNSRKEVSYCFEHRVAFERTKKTQLARLSPTSRED